MWCFLLLIYSNNPYNLLFRLFAGGLFGEACIQSKTHNVKSIRGVSHRVLSLFEFYFLCSALNYVWKFPWCGIVGERQGNLWVQPRKMKSNVIPESCSWLQFPLLREKKKREKLSRYFHQACWITPCLGRR